MKTFLKIVQKAFDIVNSDVHAYYNKDYVRDIIEALLEEALCNEAPYSEDELPF